MSKSALALNRLVVTRLYLWPFRLKETLMNFMNSAIEQTIDDKIHCCRFSDAYTDIRWIAKKRSHTIFAYDSFISIPVWHPTWGTCIFPLVYWVVFWSVWPLDLENFCINIFLYTNRLYSSMIYAPLWDERWSKLFSFFFLFFSLLASQ